MFALLGLLKHEVHERRFEPMVMAWGSLVDGTAPCRHASSNQTAPSMMGRYMGRRQLGGGSSASSPRAGADSQNREPSGLASRHSRPCRPCHHRRRPRSYVDASLTPARHTTWTSTSGSTQHVAETPAHAWRQRRPSREPGEGRHEHHQGQHHAGWNHQNRHLAAIPLKTIPLSSFHPKRYQSPPHNVTNQFQAEPKAEHQASLRVRRSLVDFRRRRAVQERGACSYMTF